MIVKITLLTCALSLSLPAVSGMVIERELSGGIRQQHLYQAGAYISLENGQLQGVVNQKTDRCLSLEASKKLYFEGSCRDLTATITQQYQAMTKELSQRYASLSMQQREGMIKSRAGIIQQKLQTQVGTRSLGTASYLEYPVTKIMLTVDGKDYAEYWLSSALQQALSKEFDIAAYDAWQNQLAGQMSQMEIKIFGGAVPDPLKDAEQKLYQQGQVMKLLPAPTLHLDGNRDYQSNTLTRIEQRELNLSDYRPPKDYKAVASWSEFLQASE